MGWKMTPILATVLGLGGQLLDRLYPDPTERARAEMELAKLQQDGALRSVEMELQRELAQAAVNQAEASNPNPLVSGWRPAVGWIGVLTLGYQYIIRPLVPWLLNVAGHPAPELPTLDDGMFELIAVMLGMGGLRSFDKLKGTSK